MDIGIIPDGTDISKMTSPRRSYVIVGAGVFGVSTAYHLIQKYPDADITLVDRDAWNSDNRVAASWDWNKVVRADYDDLIYCRLAIEAQDVFKSDPLWQPYFHETGVYWMCRGSYAQDVIRNYKTLGRKAEISAVPVAEAKELYDGLFKDADYTGVTEVLINKTSGWAAAGDCLLAVTKRAIELGVKYVTQEVSTLLMDQGRCRGVCTKSGKSFTADHVLLCTGAYTSKLLELSADEAGDNNLRAGSRIVAGGITTGMAVLDDELFPQFEKMPVGFQGYPAEIGPFMGSLPPTKDREIKWWGPTIFRNTVEVTPGYQISAPPEGRDFGQWKVSKRLQEDIQAAKRLFYGKKSENWPMAKHRICWDAFTTSGDFIISPHSSAKGLYIATCGSFHGFKFFPVLGRYITQMLEGDLAPELVQKWAWDRERPDPALNPEWPRAEMNDLQDTVAKL
ncbi:hypothetical protein NLU13_8835 [Sarocladium strictum]|uniref:FAD dependent oxidoreductase domain-containing protein n=1 Tax=Sarocladium strictum TaxID=5046 RepID=A0AA39G9K7_SARSR|nr:hypothetical protein NLU13_8835 [Sarocladium strictum]